MPRAHPALTIRAAILGGAFAVVLALAGVHLERARGAAAPTSTPMPVPQTTPSALGSGVPLPAPTPTSAGPAPVYPPSPCPSGAVDCSPAPAGTYMSTEPPPPAPVSVNPASVRVLLGHGATARLLSPPSGIVMLSGFDPNVVRAVFNPVDRTIDLLGLHTGATQVTIQSQQGQSATLSVAVLIYAGHSDSSASINITGHPATSQFVSEMAQVAATRVTYAQPGARITTGSADDSHTLDPDDAMTVHVPVEVSGDNYFTYRATVTVRVTNLAQPQLAPRVLLVSDFPETITENGTLFYSDVSFDNPARLLYYHYAPPAAPLRRVLVKVQNAGDQSSLLEMISGIAGPYTDILGVGHSSTLRFLQHEAAGEGEVFEVPPQATINVIDQMLPASNLVAGLMQMRVISGPSLRVAVVVQAADAPPTDPISDTLLSSSVRHARGIYEIPEFFYDESYTVGDPPTAVAIGKLPLPNLVQGEVLGGDYAVKQSADVNLLNPRPTASDVGLWFDPRGGRATGTLLINGDLVQLHPVSPGKPALVRRFTVPAGGFTHVSVVTMPEGGSSYPVNLLFASDPPAGAGWNLSPSLH
ncbi:MAG: hypothetical protein JO194_10975 [Candidatus Eremiobacteraeota bacterium]|nr:hypothetical protein [Candidatus Eremiobacteraeota bacterium]